MDQMTIYLLFDWSVYSRFFFFFNGTAIPEIYTLSLHDALPISAAAFYSTWAELLGGVALILGVITSAAGLLLFIDMLGAFVIVHVDHGVFASDGGFELVLTLGAISLGLALSGAGRFSVDNIALRRVPQRPAG